MNRTNRISGYWCMDYDCWPEDHPQCARREEKGRVKGSKSLFQTSIGKNDGVELQDQETIQ